MFVQGSIELYVVGGEIDSSVDFSRLVFAISIDELPDAYANGQILLLSFDFAPLKSWKLYKAVANQSVVFNAAEWMEDKINPYVKAIEAADRDGALAEALADGTITITRSDTAPIDPQLYDIWECPADNVNIGDLSASDAEIMQKNGTNDVYFYWGTDSQWHLTTMPMESSIQDSKSTAIVKSQASVWNTVNVGTEKYINGWQSILEYQNGGVTRNDFVIIADNFYIGAVGNVVQNGVDASGQPIYESTGEVYIPFIVDTVNHKLKFDGVVDFTNTNSYGTTKIDGGMVTADTALVNNLNATGNIIASNLTVGVASVGNTISSSDFLSIGGGGFRLKSNAAGTYEDPTIYGAYIRGAIIDSSTTNIRNLSVINDYGYSIIPLLVKGIQQDAFSTVNLVTTSQVSFGIYSANSTTTTRMKMASISNIEYSLIGTTPPVTPIGMVGIFQLSSNLSYEYYVTVTVYIGDSPIGSFSISYNSSLDTTIGGIRFFKYGASNGYPIVSMADTGILQSFIGEGTIRFTAVCGYNRYQSIIAINSKIVISNI